MESHWETFIKDCIVTRYIFLVQDFSCREPVDTDWIYKIPGSGKTLERKCSISVLFLLYRQATFKSEFSIFFISFVDFHGLLESIC